MVEQIGEHWGTFLEPFLVTGVNNKDEPVHLVMMKRYEDDSMIQWLHLVIVFWPNSSEAFAAPEVIDCYMIAFVPESQYLSILINIWTWMEIFIKSMFTLHQHSTTLFVLFYVAYHLRCTCNVHAPQNNVCQSLMMFALKYSNVCSLHSNVSKLSLVFYSGETNCRCHALKTLKMVQCYWSCTWWSWWS